MARIAEIKGVSAVYAEKLGSANLKTTEDFLAAAATPEARKALAEAIGISPNTLLEWANRADLHRVKGIGEQYSDLLEAAGVDTVPELAQRRPDNLVKKLIEINEVNKLVQKLPTESQVADWVNQAKALPRMLHY